MEARTQDRAGELAGAITREMSGMFADQSGRLSLYVRALDFACEALTAGERYNSIENARATMLAKAGRRAR